MDTYSETGQGNSNPGLVGQLYGIKWGVLFLTSFEVTLVSDKQPMWGDFYAKDGVDGSQDVYAYNIMFGTDTTADMANGNAGGWVLVPDTVSVPEPTTLLLLGSGLIGLAGIGRKKFKKR